MTNREFLNAVLTVSTLPTDVRDFATAEIAKLDARNEHRKNTPTKAQVENEGMKSEILALLAKRTNPMSAAEIASAFEVKTQKASALCVALEKEGKIVSNFRKTKNGKVKEYSLTANGGEDAE